MKRKLETMEPLWCQIGDFDETQKPSGSPLELLRRVAEEKPSVDRERAAVDFNYGIKYRWTSWSRAFPLPDDENGPIKTLIVPLVLSPNFGTNSTIHANLRQALVIIGSIDFPRIWPDLLSDLTSRLQTALQADDFVSVNRLLDTLNSLLKKFCQIINVENSVRLDLRYCLDNFSDPLLKTVCIISTKINSAAAAAGGFEVVSSKFRLLIEAQLLCFDMFYSLNFIDLPGYFVEPVDKWMNEFEKYLIVRDKVVGAEELQSAVFENIGLYIKKTDRSFQHYFRPFLEAAIDVLADSAKPLNLTALEFLADVIITSGRSGWFYHDHKLPQQITEKVVIPNLLLGDDDEEMFHKDYLEYIRRDVKDPNSRRMITCRIFRGIVYNGGYSKEIQKLIRDWLASFAENPTANWKHKECAISVVLSYKREPTPIVDVEGFFRSAIVPELKSHDVNSFPILKAAALKFFTKFWSHVQGTDLVGDVVRLLGSDANVVHSYAAIFIKKRFLQKDRGALLPMLPVLSKNLFHALGKRGSEENKYVMQCILHVRAISPCGVIISSTSVVISNWFSCENPKRSPDRLFEAFDYILTRSYKDCNPLIPGLETWILPSVRMILDKHITEFFPYALRLLARLLDYNKRVVPPHYRRLIFDILNMLIVQLILS